MARKKGSPARYQENGEHRKIAIKFAEVGVTQQQISDALGISVDTLQKFYGDEMRAARATAVATVAGALYRNAARGKAPDVFFYLKTQGGWRERDPNVGEGAKPQRSINFVRGKTRPSKARKDDSSDSEAA